MGVEINPNLCAAARENFELNNITNASVVVCDSGRFATQILRTKRYILYAPVTPAVGAPIVAEDIAEVANIAPVINTLNSSAGDGETDPATAATAAAAAAARRARKHQHLQRKQAKPERVPEYVFSFGAVLVDPPRCGLDSLTLSLVANYDHIIYISCCPESLMRDLTQVPYALRCGTPWYCSAPCCLSF
jgi:tRNA/tmRNA/rRNA uracil-C5-methylase (TrmA/RlmC/RlmD family)